MVYEHVAGDDQAARDLAESASYVHLLDSLNPSAASEIRDKLTRADPLAALTLAVDAGDLETATDVVRIAWFELLRDHGDDIRPLLEPLPLAQLRSHPLLATLLGISYNGVGFRRAKAVHYFGLAAVGARSKADGASPAERALILASESGGFRLIGQASMAVNSARAALGVLDSMIDDRPVGALPRIYSQLGVSLYYGGEADEALDAFAKGYAESGDRDPSGFSNLAMMAGIHAFEGDISEAREYVRLARGEPWTDDQRTMYTGTFYRLAEAVLALERFDPVAAQRHLDAMIHERRTIEHWVDIARAEALTALLAGEPAVALARLDAFVVMRGSEGRKPANRAALASIRALLHVSLGNLDAARTVLRRDAARLPQSNVDRARIELLTGRPGEALRELNAIAGADQSARTSAESGALRAAVLLRVSPGARSRAAVEELVALLRVTGQRMALALMPREDCERLRLLAGELGHGDLFEGLPVTSVLVEDSPASQLSPKETAVLRELAKTGSATEMAERLFVSVNTVKSHLKTIYRKLEVRNREDALTVAMARHLLQPSDD